MYQSDQLISVVNYSITTVYCSTEASESAVRSVNEHIRLLCIKVTQKIANMGATLRLLLAMG